MEQLIIQSLGFLLRFQEDIKIPQPHGTINHTIIRVSCRVSRRYQNPAARKEQLTLQFLISFKQISRSCGHMEQLNIQSLGFLLGFQHNIKIPPATWNIFHTVFGFLLGFQEDINIIIIIVILACPDARCESGQTSGSCRNINDTNNADEINHDNKTCEYYNMVMMRTNPKSCPNNTDHNNTVHDKHCLLTMKTIDSIL